MRLLILLPFLVLSLLFSGCSGKKASLAESEQPPVLLEPQLPDGTTGGIDNSEFEDESFDDDPFGDDEFEDDDFDDYEDVDAVADPLYGFNNAMFQLNDKFIYVLLKPVALGYRAMVPTPARKGIRNVFDNLLTPVRMINCILQGKIDSAGTEFVRFFINTTAGIGGLMDVAKNHNGIDMVDEDLGQTLAHYGIGNGFYMVLPLLGPTTARDLMGLAGDSYLSPLFHLKPVVFAYASRGFDTQNRYSFTVELYEDIRDSSIVPYEAFKDIYIQHRKKLISE